VNQYLASVSKQELQPGNSEAYPRRIVVMLTKPLITAGLAGLLSFGLPLSGSAGAEASTASAAPENQLQLVEKDRRSSLFADPAVDWASYRQIQLLDATVSFRRNWQRDQNTSHPFKVRDEDVVEIKQSLADLLNEVFTRELTEQGGYTMSTEAGEQVLIIKPAIVELDIAAPDTMRTGINRQYTDSAGRMTLEFELIDSVSGKVLAKASDRYEDPRRGWFNWTNSVTNRADARRTLQRWASDLRERLNEGRFNASTLASTDK
jgi:hypothetical protein